MKINNEQLLEMLALDNIKNTIKTYGIEGTEDAIIRVYSRMPTIKAIMLKTLKKYYYAKSN